MDVVIDFSGEVSGLNTAIALCKYNGKVIAGSMYKKANSELKLGKEFHWNNIKIISAIINQEIKNNNASLIITSLANKYSFDYDKVLNL